MVPAQFATDRLDLQFDHIAHEKGALAAQASSN